VDNRPQIVVPVNRRNLAAQRHDNAMLISDTHNTTTYTQEVGILLLTPTIQPIADNKKKEGNVNDEIDNNIIDILRFFY
jgi:hypothetical protein